MKLLKKSLATYRLAQQLTTFTVQQCHKPCQHLPWLEQPPLEANSRFSRKGKGPAFPPYVPGGGGGPSCSGSGGPPGGGPPGGGGGGPPGGGGIFPTVGPGAAGGGGGKLGGNPPRIFDRTCSEANTFMNEFNLYRLTNIGADQVDVPMKRAALLLEGSVHKT